MKTVKHYLSAACLVLTLLLTVTACGESPVKKSIAIIDGAIEKLEKTDDAFEALGIYNQMLSDLSVIDAAHRDYKPTEDEVRQIRDKLNEVTRVGVKKTTSAIPNMAGSIPEELSDPGDYQEFTEELIDKLLPK